MRLLAIEERGVHLKPLARGAGIDTATGHFCSAFIGRGKMGEIAADAHLSLHEKQANTTVGGPGLRGARPEHPTEKKVWWPGGEVTEQLQP